MRTFFLPAVAMSLVLSVPGVAHAAGTYRDDDGTRETAVLLDSFYDRATKRLHLPSGHLAGATGATLWLYARAEACAEPGWDDDIRVNEGYLVASYDPCALWSESSYGWHGFPIPMARLKDGQVNEFRIYSSNGTRTGHNAYYGVDTTSDNGRSDVHEEDPSFSGDIDGELMVYLELTGSPPVASPSSVVFGLRDVGTASVPETVSVTRYGTESLDVSNVTIAGAHAGDFAISADTCTSTSSPPGTACTFQVTFTPQAKGSRLATVTLATNVGDHPVPLHGEGRSDPPVTTFTTPDGAVLTRLESVTGTVTDDTGLSYVDVTFTPAAPALARVTTRARSSCDPARTACDWSIELLYLAPGLYTVTSRGTDTQGMAESPGPSISVVVS